MAVRCLWPDKLGEGCIMGRTPRAEGDPILIKKYANRRLYNTATSSYVTLDDLAEIIRQGEEIKVVDAKSGDDLTHTVMAQIILDKEATDETMLPPSFLRQVISLYGKGVEKMVPGYLTKTMEAFLKNQDKLRQTLMGGQSTANLMPMWDEMARQNMKIFQSTMQAWGGFAGGKPAAQEDAKDKEIADLKAELARLKKKVDALNS